MTFISRAMERTEPNLRVAGQAMLAALALFGMGSQTGSSVAVYASSVIALYALFIPGAAWKLVVAPDTWKFAGAIALRLAMFAVAITAAGYLANAGSVLGSLGSLAFIAVLAAAAFVVGTGLWRLGCRVLAATWRSTVRQRHVVDHWVMLVRLSLG